MIKFFQKLKAKKGFTLVELIVVIAIIGVLAAILVPTMLGYVTSSRVTSVDTTASSIKKEIDSFLTSCDTAGYGFKKGSGNWYTVTASIGATAATEGQWNLTITAESGAAALPTNATITAWAGGAVAPALAGSVKTCDAAKSEAGGDGAKLLAITLAQLFPEVTTGSISAVISGGTCIAVSFSTDTTTPADISAKDLYGISAGTITKTESPWDGSTAGVSGKTADMGGSIAEGNIIGTAPKLGMKV